MTVIGARGVATIKEKSEKPLGRYVLFFDGDRTRVTALERYCVRGL